MKHLCSAFGTDIKLFNKGFVANTPVLQPLLPCLLRHFCDVLFQFVNCTFFHYPEGFLAYLPTATSPCQLVNLVLKFGFLISSDIIGRVFAPSLFFDFVPRQVFTGQM